MAEKDLEIIAIDLIKSSENKIKDLAPKAMKGDIEALAAINSTLSKISVYSKVASVSINPDILTIASNAVSDGNNSIIKREFKRDNFMSLNEQTLKYMQNNQMLHNKEHNIKDENLVENIIENNIASSVYEKGEEFILSEITNKIINKIESQRYTIMNDVNLSDKEKTKKLRQIDRDISFAYSKDEAFADIVDGYFEKHPEELNGLTEEEQAKKKNDFKNDRLEHDINPGKDLGDDERAEKNQRDTAGAVLAEERERQKLLRANEERRQERFNRLIDEFVNTDLDRSFVLGIIDKIVEAVKHKENHPELSKKDKEQHEKDMLDMKKEIIKPGLKEEEFDEKLNQFREQKEVAQSRKELRSEGEDIKSKESEHSKDQTQRDSLFDGLFDDVKISLKDVSKDDDPGSPDKTPRTPSPSGHSR